MADIKKQKTAATKPVKSKSINLRYSETLQQRAERYAAVSGFTIPAMFRNGLDLLLRNNNF